MLRKICILTVVLISIVLSEIVADAATSLGEFLNLCARGTPQEIETAIRAGINLTDENKATALLRTAFSYGPEFVSALIDAGADVNAKGRHGETPLMLATRGNNPEVLRVLIENGADVNALDLQGRSVLAYSLLRWNDHDGLEIVSVLLEAGGKISIDHLKTMRWREIDVYNRVKEACDPAYAVPFSLLASIRNSTPDEVKKLIQDGADVNAKDMDEVTPLMLAARFNKNSEVLSVLIDRGAEIDARNYRGWTPLMFASRFNENPEILRVLVDRGANVNIRDENDQTPLMLAAKYCVNPEILRILIRNGADVNARHADDGSHHDWLSKKWLGRTPLMFAAEYNKNPEILRVLIENGADVNALDLGGWSVLGYSLLPLGYCFLSPRSEEIISEKVSVLLEAGAKVYPDDFWAAHKNRKKLDSAVYDRLGKALDRNNVIRE
jgi:ankyrin repeat protein